LLFVSLHLPGWYFMGHLRERLTAPLGGAFSIFLLGLAFGYVTYRSRSVAAGVVAHFVNNLAAWTEFSRALEIKFHPDSSLSLVHQRSCSPLFCGDLRDSRGQLSTR
jgi:membrane protease YdiL (CAAX protease family)